MRPIPDLRLEDLREIADRKWDVLAATHQSASGTDLYDTFLATGAEMMWNGSSETQVGDYFVDIAIEKLGVDTGSGIRERSQTFARAIREYLQAQEEPAVGGLGICSS
jgi:hypothetical protein